MRFCVCVGGEFIFSVGHTMKIPISPNAKTNEPWHVISNNVAFWQVLTQTSLCSLLLSLETPNDVQSVA